MQANLKQNMSSHPMTARQKDDLGAAYLRMKREGYRHLLVIDENGDLSGIISDRDFQRAMWPSSEVDAHGLPEGPKFPKDAKVGAYMSSPVRSLPEETELIAAVHLMIDNKISAVAITSGDVITGIITHEDMLRVLSALLREPVTLRKQIQEFTYSSSLGRVMEMLSAVGV